MSDLISRNAVLRLIRNLRHGKKLKRSKQSVADRAATEIAALPSAEEIGRMFPTKEGFGRVVQMYSQDQLDAIRATDRETTAKAAQAWAEPRMGAHTARQLADFIRGRA